MGFIDAHIHVWNQDRRRYPAPGVGATEPVPASFEAEDVWRHASPSGVDRVVLIQFSIYRTDNSLMLDTIAAAPEAFRGVAIIDPAAPELGTTVAGLRERGVRGFRVGTGGDRDGWAETPAMTDLLAACRDQGLALCPLIEPGALPSLARACERFPETTVVLDHFCRIGADGTIRDEEVAALGDLARFPKVHVKVSAFYAFGAKRPPHTELLPMIGALIAAYGSERLMWASDAPYQIVNESYEDGLSLVRDLLEVSDEQREDLLWRTAERVLFW